MKKRFLILAVFVCAIVSVVLVSVHWSPPMVDAEPAPSIVPVGSLPSSCGILPLYLLVSNGDLYGGDGSGNCSQLATPGGTPGGPYLPLSGGTMTGPIYLAYDTWVYSSDGLQRLFPYLNDATIINGGGSGGTGMAEIFRSAPLSNANIACWDNEGNYGVGPCAGTLATSNPFSVTQAGLVTSAKTSTVTSSAPTVASNAGTGSLTHGTDNSGIIATGTASTATTLTFGVAWGTWASCTVSASTSTALPYVSAISKTAATFTYVTTGTPTLYYNCNGD